jgi:DNA primase
LSWFGRAAVVFPVCRDDLLVAATGRYLDDRAPRFHTVGAKSEGVFIASPGALGSTVVAITEGALDALSLAAVGVASIALNGATWPDWLPSRLAFQGAALAMDADQVGDAAADQLAAVLRSLGSQIERWRPPRKDWNQALMECGIDGVRLALGACATAAEG